MNPKNPLGIIDASCQPPSQVQSRSPGQLQSEEEMIGLDPTPAHPMRTLSRESSFAQFASWQPGSPLDSDSQSPSYPYRQYSQSSENDNSSCNSPSPGLLRSSSGLPLLSHRDTASPIRPIPASRLSELRGHTASTKQNPEYAGRGHHHHKFPSLSRLPKQSKASSTAVASGQSMELEELPHGHRTRPSQARFDDSSSHEHGAKSSAPSLSYISDEHRDDLRRKLPRELRRQHQCDELESDLIKEALTVGDILSFLRDYSQFRERPSGKIFDSLIWVETFAPPVVAPVSDPENQAVDRKSLGPEKGRRKKGRSKNSEDASAFLPKESFSQNLCRLRSLLQTQKCNCSLQLCILATKSDCVEEMFSFMQKAKASTKAQIGRLFGAPRRALIHTVSLEWDLEEDAFRRLLEVNTSESVSVRLPSAGPPPPPFDLSHLDGTSFTLRWQAKCPKYTMDFDVYVWQPFRKPPRDRYVQVHVLPTHSYNARRMILLVEDSHQLRRLRESRLQIRSDKVQNQFLVEDEILTTTFVVFDHMLSDTTRFLEGAIEQCNQLLYDGRARPSGSKVQFLAHLNDCLNKAVEDLGHSLICLSQVQRFLEECGQSLPDWDARDSYMKHTCNLKVDLEFLQDEFRGLGKRVNGFDGLRTMINEHINLLQNRRTMIITVLLALYVPLSFMTSFLGMNVWTERPKKGQKADGKIWSLNTFFIVSLPLAFGSIVVPLILGAIIRYIVQYILKHRAYWRIICAFLLFVYALTCYILVPILLPPIPGSTFVGALLMIITDILLIFFAIWKVYWA
ncbi:hypothetical protein L228DRAFT_262935, partial [Xylona heveae TC161]